MTDQTAAARADREAREDDHAAEEYAEAFLNGPIAAANYRASRLRAARAREEFEAYAERMERLYNVQ